MTIRELKELHYEFIFAENGEMDGNEIILVLKQQQISINSRLLLRNIFVKN